MVKRFLAIFFILSVAVSAREPYSKAIESYLTVDPIRPFDRSKIDFNSNVGILVGSSYAVFSPRGTVYANGNFDGNFGIGVRTPLDGYTLGAHLFYDYSRQLQGQMVQFFQQAGFSAEMLTDDVDVRFNYYLPVLGRSSCPNYKSQTQHWVETEIFYKLGSFSIGLNPVYSIDTNTLSVRPKVVFPMQYATVEAGANLSPLSQECVSYVSLIIPLYKTGKSPVLRCSSVRTYMDSYPSYGEEKKSPWPFPKK